MEPTVLLEAKAAPSLAAANALDAVARQFFGLQQGYLGGLYESDYLHTARPRRDLRVRRNG